MSKVGWFHHVSPVSKLDVGWDLFKEIMRTVTHFDQIFVRPRGIRLFAPRSSDYLIIPDDTRTDFIA
jgi:hypothetical protein